MASEKRLEDFIVRDAKIVFTNFEGREGDFNRAGDRNFGLVIDNPEFEAGLREDGWNIKEWVPKDRPDEEPLVYLPVKVQYHVDDGLEYLSPKIYKVTATNTILLSDETVGSLDHEKITKVDLVITPSRWNVSGKTGIKAYVKKMYVTIDEDELDRIYQNRDMQD